MNETSATGTLASNHYGKSRVRLTRVGRESPRRSLMEMTVDIQLEGDFAASYTDGDNANVVATDSMKNTVYVLACEQPFEAIEGFARILAEHFVTTYPQVDRVTINLCQHLFQRIDAGEGTGIADDPRGADGHDHSFVGGISETRTARAVAGASDGKGHALTLSGGLSGLVLLKTDGSAFVDFVSDRFRTLPDSRLRIFATTVDAAWSYADAAAVTDARADETYRAIRASMLRGFAQHESLAVQQTLLAMGQDALGVAPAIEAIDLSLPNQHRVPFNLEPFGHENDATIFVTTDEPAGQIAGRVVRDGSKAAAKPATKGVNGC